MIGTIDKNRTEEIALDTFTKLKQGSAKENKIRLVEEFLKIKLTDAKREEFDLEEENIKKNPYKYDIYEEKDFITDGDLQTTSRKVRTTLPTPAETDAGLNPKSADGKQSPNCSEKNLKDEEDLKE